MTVEEMFCDLYDKYGEEFNWRMLPFSDKYFVEELKKEIGMGNQLFDKVIYAVARSYSADDALYLVDNVKGKDVYRIYHLTYNYVNSDGFPKCIELCGIEELKDYLENQFIEEFM